MECRGISNRGARDCDAWRAVRSMKAIVVTGASTGIGWGCVKVLIAGGFRVFGSVRRPADAERLAAQFGANFTPLTPLGFLPRSASIYPDRVAVVHGDRRITYREFDLRARRLASALARRGIEPGDTVSAVLPNVPAMLEAHYGVPMTKGVLNTVNTRLDAATIGFILDHAETKVLITDREFSKTMKEALALAKVKPLVIELREENEAKQKLHERARTAESERVRLREVLQKAKDALAHLLFAVVGPDDAVVSPNPAYPIHQYGVIMAEGHACLLPMPTAAEFLERLKHLYKTSTRKPKLILISFPHNPTTTCVDLDFFREIVELAREHGSMIVHDFAYADLCFDGYKAPSILEVDGAKEVAVEMFSMTKSYNMAGWRVGFMVGNPDLVAALARIKSYHDYGMFTPIQVASIVALEGPQDCVEQIQMTYQKRRDVLCSGLDGLGWQVSVPKATMYVWAPIPEAYREMGSLEFAKKLLADARVAVSPGIGFGQYGDDHVRFSMIENEARTRQAIRGIRDMFRRDGLLKVAATG
jgi:alanine-synthesizing transaminase